MVLLPGVPQNVRANVIMQSSWLSPVVEVSWDPPEGHNELDITSYIVQTTDGDEISEEKLDARRTTKVIHAPRTKVESSSFVGAILKVSVAAENETGIGPEQFVQVAIEDKMGPENSDATQELDGDSNRYLEKVCKEYVEKKGKTLKVCLIGRQHHGKSSFMNHLYRVLGKELDVSDQFVTAPPGTMETTLEASQLELLVHGQLKMELTDTPAFSSLDDHNSKRLQNFIAVGPTIGWRRTDSNQVTSSICPPDAVIVVVSLMAYRAEKQETAAFLKRLDRELKNATRSKLVIPIVVVATHKDDFLKEVGQEGVDPVKDLDAVMNDLKRVADTSNVYAITNYKVDDLWCSQNNTATFRLLRDVVTFAKNRNTKVQPGKEMCCMGVDLMAEGMNFLSEVGAGVSRKASAWWAHFFGKVASCCAKQD